MRKAAGFAAFLVFALCRFPLAGQDKPDLSGTWQFDASKSELISVKLAAATWVIEETVNSIHITESEGSQSRKIELECTTDGKDCDVKGDKAKASFWYNGPLLVEMETRNDHVDRYRIKLSEDGKTLTVNLTHIVPKGDKDDVLVFDKHT